MEKITDIEKKEELKELAATLSPRQLKVMELASNGIPFYPAMRKAGYLTGHISRSLHNKLPPKSRIQKLKMLFEDSYSLQAKKIGLSGEKCANVISDVLNNNKSRTFDKLMAVKEHHRILMSANRGMQSGSSISLQAKNVLILGSKTSIDDFNKQSIEQ